MENMFKLMGSEEFSDRRRCIWVNGPVIVGAGPLGLATAACLHEQGVPFVVLERADCIASLWQRRTYDRLKLHLPKKVCQLPKMPFPENYPEYPTKRQFIDYLESYANRFEISPQFNECVKSARYEEISGLWRIKTKTSSVAGSEMEYICQWLVVATGENAERVVPEIDGLTTRFEGEVIHSCEYKTGEKYRGKSVLVVGCGNSGSCLAEGDFWQSDFRNLDDADEVATSMASRQASADSCMADFGKFDKVWGKEAQYGTNGTQSRYRKDSSTGIKRFYRNHVEFVDGQRLDLDAVVLATGYRSNVPSWLQENDLFSKIGFPKSAFPNAWKGKSGLYAAGFTRKGLAGASADAVDIAQDIGNVWREDTKLQKVRSRVVYRR